MNPLYLSEDELRYELSIRRISLIDPNKLEELTQLIEKEIAGTIEVPTYRTRLTREFVDKEVQVCVNKAEEIFGFVGAALRDADDQLAECGQTRLIHLNQRLERLQHFDPTNSTVIRLRTRVIDMQTDTAAAREDFFGGGQQPNLEEDDEQAGAQPLDQQRTPNTVVIHQPTELGAIPKKTGTSGSMPNISQPNPTATTKVIVSNAQEWRNPHKQVPSSNNTNATRSMGSLAEMLDRNLTVQNTLHNSHVQQFVDRAIIDARLYPTNHHSLNPEAPRYVPVQPLQHPVQQTQAHHRIRSPEIEQLPNQERRFELLAGGHHIHKWNLRFDGTPGGLDAEDFLYRIERQAQLYGVTHPALLIGVVNLLSGRAAQWYWTNQRTAENETWDKFKQALIRRYAPHKPTDYEIRSRLESRKQLTNEPFNDYCQDVEAMAARMRRRMPREELIEVLQRNMSMSLRRALWRETFETVDELLEACSDFERLCRDEEQWAKQRRPMRIGEVGVSEENILPVRNSASYNLCTPQVKAMEYAARNRSDLAICWNCNDIGHFFSNCPKPQMAFFCFGCGEKNVISVHCTKCSGNSRREPSATDTVHQQQTRQGMQQPPPPVHIAQNPFNKGAKTTQPPPRYQ